MPVLNNRRREEFGQLGVERAALNEAYGRAGFATDRGDPRRLEAHQVVAAGITEPKDDEGLAREAGQPDVIATPRRMIRAGIELRQPPGRRAARVTIPQASPPREELMKGVAASAKESVEALRKDGVR
jgi:hypothetical protein